MVRDIIWQYTIISGSMLECTTTYMLI